MCSDCFKYATHAKIIQQLLCHNCIVGKLVSIALRTKPSQLQAAQAAARPRTKEEMDQAYEAALSPLKVDSLKGIAEDRHHYAK